MPHQINYFATKCIDDVGSLFSVTMSQNLNQIVMTIFCLGQIDCVTLEFIKNSFLDVLRSLFKQALNNADRIVRKDQLNNQRQKKLEMQYQNETGCGLNKPQASVL